MLGSLYALMPSRIGLLPRLLTLSLAHMLAPRAERDTLPEHPRYYSKRGLVGISDDLSVEALIANYSRGFFPVCHLGPMKWWCPEERAVIDPANTHLSRNLRRLLRQEKFSVTFDRDFVGVMEACAEPRPGKTPLTWITPKIMEAFLAAHEAGYAHSVEVWDRGRQARGRVVRARHRQSVVRRVAILGRRARLQGRGRGAASASRFVGLPCARRPMDDAASGELRFPQRAARGVSGPVAR